MGDGGQASRLTRHRCSYRVNLISSILAIIIIFTLRCRTWNKVTGPNAPLYDMTGSPDLSVHSCVEMWKKGGGRPEQM